MRIWYFSQGHPPAYIRSPSHGGLGNGTVRIRKERIHQSDVKDGNVIEQGSHEELMRAGGAYCELYNSQFDN